MNPTKALSHFIAYQYYDCMSSGMPKWDIIIARLLCLHSSINKTKKFILMVRKDNWHTINDFLEETKNIEKEY